MQDRGSLGDRFVSALSIKKNTSPVSSSASSSSVMASSITTSPATFVKQSDIVAAVEDDKDPSQVGC